MYWTYCIGAWTGCHCADMLQFVLLNEKCCMLECVPEGLINRSRSRAWRTQNAKSHFLEQWPRSRVPCGVARAWFNIKIFFLSHNWISYTGKISLYWIGVHVIMIMLEVLIRSLVLFSLQYTYLSMLAWIFPGAPSMGLPKISRLTWQVWVYTQFVVLSFYISSFQWIHMMHLPVFFRVSPLPSTS